MQNRVFGRRYRMTNWPKNLSDIELKQIHDSLALLIDSGERCEPDDMSEFEACEKEIERRKKSGDYDP